MNNVDIMFVVRAAIGLVIFIGLVLYVFGELENARHEARLWKAAMDRADREKEEREKK